MKNSTKNRKESATKITQVLKDFGLLDLLAIQAQGKSAFDDLRYKMGGMIVESLLCAEREAMTGKDYRPVEEGLYKWGFQQGSVYIGDQKRKIMRPRVQGEDGEVKLPIYEKLKNADAFSEELLTKLMAGVSGRQYKSTVTKACEAFGVSPSSVSRKFVKASANKLKTFIERSLSGFKPFAILIDTVHRGGAAFIVALGIDVNGDKMVLGFWEGATENSTITQALFNDLTSRGLALTDEILFLTDGGSGVIKALKDRFKTRLLHQRCTIHKDRNIQTHLAKKYRKAAHRNFKNALAHKSYKDAKAELLKMIVWLEDINPSSANSLREGMEELLTLHRLGVPEELRRVLSTTNGIENLFSTTRHREKNLKNYNPEYRGKAVKKGLSQRWLGAVLLNAESGFRKVKGFADIKQVMLNIRKLRNEDVDNEMEIAA